MKVLAIGECMAELAPTGTARTFTLGFAGDTFNTAWYLARVAPKISVSYFTAVGDDALSRDMRGFIRESGIHDSHVQVIANKTVGLYQIHLEQGERSFTYWRGPSAAKHLADDAAALQSAIAAADVVYFSGITLAILDPEARDRLFTALNAGRQMGNTIVFDTNLRPRLWASPDEMTDTVMRAAPLAQIILPSFDDEAHWFGDQAPDATLNRYAATGAERVIVKNNQETVVFQDHGARGEVPVDKVASPVDTTAAGDSFNAGALAGLLAGQPMVPSIQNGCRIAGQVVRQTGALVPVVADDTPPPRETTS